MVPVPRRTSQTMPTIRETVDEKTSNTKVARAVDPSRPVSGVSSCQSLLDAHAALLLYNGSGPLLWEYRLRPAAVLPRNIALLPVTREEKSRARLPVPGITAHHSTGMGRRGG